MSVFATKPFSRLWHGRSRSESRTDPADFVGDAAPPFAELASGLEPVPTAEEVERIRYYHSKMTVRDAEFVVRAYSCARCFGFVGITLADLLVWVKGYGLD